MTDDELKKMLIRSLVGTVVKILFAFSIVYAWDGEFVQAGLLFIALSVERIS